MLAGRLTAAALLSIIVLIIVNSLTPLSYYGYPAPRHSKYVKTVAETPVLSVSVLSAWLNSVSLGNYSKVLIKHPYNASVRLLNNVLLNGSEYSLLIGSTQLRFLNSLINGSAVINSSLIARLIFSAISFTYRLGITNSPEVLTNALSMRSNPSLALSYVSLALLKEVSLGGNISKTVAKLVRLIALFYSYVMVKDYSDALVIARRVAANHSLIAAIYMFLMIPKSAWNLTVNSSRTSTELNANLSHRLTGGSISLSNLSLKEVIKAALIIRRLGPKAVIILEQVPLPTLLRAASNLSITILRNASVSELVSMISKAIKSRVSGGVANGQLPVGGYKVRANWSGTGWVPAPPLRGGPRHYRALIPSAFNPVIKSWVRPSEAASPRGIPSQVKVNLTLIERAVKPVVGLISSISLPRPALANITGQVTYSTRARGVGIIGLPVVAAVSASAAASFLALALLVGKGRESQVAGGVRGLVRRVEEAPPVIKEFWEAVNYLARKSRVELKPSMTHREICEALLKRVSEGSAAGKAMRKLTRAYEGVKYAGARVNELLISRVREFLNEVMRS